MAKLRGKHYKGNDLKDSQLKLIWYIKESINECYFIKGFANNTAKKEDILDAIDSGILNYIKEYLKDSK